MQEIFVDPSLNSKIDKDGFALMPFAERDALDELKAFYNQLPSPSLKGTHVTMFNPSVDYRKSVEAKIRDMFAAKAEQLMKGYRVLYTNFLIKEVGPEGDFPVHQDWTYVDESKFTSVAFWIPLQDVDNDNGALHVVRGSHKFITALRGPHVHEPFHQISNVIKQKYSEPVNMKAGEALVWDHRLIHFSLPNLSSSPRFAFTLIMVPKEAKVYHCFGLNESGGTTVQKYAVDTDFYMRNTINTKPEGVELSETVQQPQITFLETDFEKMYKQHNPFVQHPMV